MYYVAAGPDLRVLDADNMAPGPGKHVVMFPTKLKVSAYERFLFCGYCGQLMDEPPFMGVLGEAGLREEDFQELCHTIASSNNYNQRKTGEGGWFDLVTLWIPAMMNNCQRWSCGKPMEVYITERAAAVAAFNEKYKERGVTVVALKGHRGLVFTVTKDEV